jgi:hypothetical protein
VQPAPPYLAGRHGGGDGAHQAVAAQVEVESNICKQFIMF